MKVHKVKAQPRKNFQAPIASRVPTKKRTMINYRKRVITLDEIVNNDDDDVQEDFLLAPPPPREDDDDDREEDEGIFFSSIMCC